MSRVKRHFLLFVFSITLTFIIFMSIDVPSTKYLFSMGTAYTGLVLIAATLLVGPLNLILKKPNPVSSYLRRDIGIWAAIVSLIHMFIGLEMHFGGKYIKYFFKETDTGLTPLINAFGLANYTGLIVGILCVVLLFMSNNASIKKYGVKMWKKLQQYNYVLFVLVIGHGFIYQLIEKRALHYMLIVGVIFVVVLAIQWKGFKLYGAR